TVAMHP
ncbi:NAD(P)H binding domain of trans-2-enoyl-CoA reductase family protein, partial [Vibrio parahaemolyticus V-223/04]